MRDRWGTNRGQRETKEDTQKQLHKRKLGKETCIKHAYRNRKCDKEIQEAGMAGGKKKGECMENVTLHEQKETNMKNEVA